MKKSELSPPKIVKRIFSYTLSLVFLVIEIFMIIEGSIFGLLVSSITLALVSIYIYDDIRAIRADFNKRKTNFEDNEKINKSK